MLHTAVPRVSWMRPLGEGRERRLVMRLLAYWEEVRGDRKFPPLADIDPRAIDDMWPHCFVLDVVAGVDYPIFHYLGPALAKYSGVYLSGRSVAETPHQTLLDRATFHFRQVLKTGMPIASDDEFERFDGVRIIYRSIVLPLSDDQETINYLLGAANGKELTGKRGIAAS